MWTWFLGSWPAAEEQTEDYKIVNYTLAMLVWAAVSELCFKQSDSILLFGLKQKLMGSNWSLQCSSHRLIPWCICYVLQAHVAFKWSGNLAAMETDQLADDKTNITLTRVNCNVFIPTWSEWSSASYQPRLPMVHLSCEADVVSSLPTVTEGGERQEDDGAGDCGPDQQAAGC